MMHRKTAQALAVVALATLPMFASAQLTANVALTSNYKFRGQDQDTGRSRAFKPAIQGGFDYAFGESGWYVGNWNSSVNWLPGNSIESDLYGGYKFTAGGVNWDVGALTYIYPGAKQANTTELYGAGSVGPLTLHALDAYLATRGKNTGETVLMRALEALQGERYLRLAERRPANEAFLYGWLANRIGTVG